MAEGPVGGLSVTGEAVFSLGKLPRETRKPGRTAQKRGSLHPWEWEAPPQPWNRDKGYTPTWLKGERGSVWWESVFSPVSKYLDIALKNLVVGTMYFKRREWFYSTIPKNKQALGSNRLDLSSGSSSPAHLWFNLGKFHQPRTKQFPAHSIVMGLNERDPSKVLSPAACTGSRTNAAAQGL